MEVRFADASAGGVSAARRLSSDSNGSGASLPSILNNYVYQDRVPGFNLVFDEEKLLEANRRHDTAAHTVSMDTKARYTLPFKRLD
jgi:hypothetical protein